MFRPGTLSWIVLALVSALLPSHTASPQEIDARLSSPADDERTHHELLVLGASGLLIEQARTDVLEILENQGSCAAWFRETEPAVTTVFRSLHYELGNGTSQILLMPDDSGAAWFKHPWGASTMEYGGQDSVITINRNGPFFVQETRLSKLGAIGGPSFPAGWHVVLVGPYAGDTLEARMTILLHELGHIVGRLPMDDGSWNGESARNTVTVLQHCKAEMNLLARRRKNAGKSGDLRDTSRQTASRDKS